VPDSVLITGTAGDIGAATALAFVRAGYAVVGLDRAPSRLLARADVDRQPSWIEGDLGDERSVERALEATGDGPLVHVVGVAGGALDCEVTAETKGLLPTLEQFCASVEQNLTLQYSLVSRTLPRLRDAAELGRLPSITLISSINALASYGLPAYSAAKAGLSGLAVALTDRLGRHGIRINVLALGTVPTGRTRDLYSADDFNALKRETALARLPSPEDVGNTVLAIATLMTHTTGQVLVADGGQLIHRDSSAGARAERRRDPGRAHG
jgi:3-oxoacyl-[acyl-carrier protein] reductase